MRWIIFLHHLDVVVLATSRHNISLEEDVYDELVKYVAKKGIKISTWININININIKMKEFIEDEKMIEEYREKKKRS